MKYFFYLLITICFARCTYNPPYQITDKERAANSVRKNAAIKIAKETGLVPCGTGGQMMDQIKMLALSFDYNKPVDTEKARQLLVNSIDIFLAEINADPDIQRYLDNVPFEPKNVEIRIFLRGRDHIDVPAGELSVISVIDGILNYKIDNPETKLFTTIYSEAYAEAKQKLTKEYQGEVQI